MARLAASEDIYGRCDHVAPLLLKPIRARNGWRTEKVPIALLLNYPSPTHVVEAGVSQSALRKPGSGGIATAVGAFHTSGSNTAASHLTSMQPTRASARRYSGFSASTAARRFPRHGPAAVTTGTRAGARDTNAPGKRDHGRPGYSSRSGSRTDAATPHRAHWWGRQRVRSCARPLPPLLLPLRQPPG
jgi:hypothetical protein